MLSCLVEVGKMRKEGEERERVHPPSLENEGTPLRSLPGGQTQLPRSFGQVELVSVDL